MSAYRRFILASWWRKASPRGKITSGPKWWCSAVARVMHWTSIDAATAVFPEDYDWEKELPGIQAEIARKYWWRR